MNIRHLLRQTIARATQTGISAAGEPTYGTATTYIARVEEANSHARQGASGTEKQSATVIVTLEEIGLSDRVWINGDSTSDTSLARTPMTSEAMTDLQGRILAWRTTL